MCLEHVKWLQMLLYYSDTIFRLVLRVCTKCGWRWPNFEIIFPCKSVLFALTVDIYHLSTPWPPQWQHVAEKPKCHWQNSPLSKWIKLWCRHSLNACTGNSIWAHLLAKSRGRLWLKHLRFNFQSPVFHLLLLESSIFGCVHYCRHSVKMTM